MRTKICFALFLALLVLRVEAQTATTDPVEVEALKVFASKLGISSLWNFSVDPCSGLDGWNNTSGASSFQPAAGIECLCENQTCHVQKIFVVAIDAAGEIAPQIGNFSRLNNLNLAQNVITGRIPEEIGSLSNLQYLSVGINRMFGTIPVSFGKLKNLVSIGIGTNYFTGSLPKEIGNLNVLQSLYMDSSGLGGEIPSEFGKLQSLQTIWMADNGFNGTIPESFRNLTSLQILKMDGNNFQGPIPSFLGDLKTLTQLYLGDVSSGGAIPASFNQLENLTTLSMRNCELSGALPSLSNLTSLVFLDLSNNNLTGRIPDSLASLTSLETLLLADNNFTGTLPSFLGSMKSLQRLDVSSNSLSGRLPSWTSNSSLETNIVENNFNASSTRFTGLTAPAMRCLETGSACSEVDRGENFQFAINCGGPEVLSSTQMRFRDDTASLVNEAYYSNSSSPWAVSISGYSGGGFKTAVSTTTRVTGTRDPTLYQTARSSPNSLKYYGLGMPNGTYTLRLHFAEIVILDNGTRWTGLGRRFFHVYVQGQRVLESFNIQAEAGGSFKPVVKNFSTLVSNSVLEVHLLWTGKGTCCSPSPDSFGPLISAIQVDPEFDTSGFSDADTPTSSSSSNSVGIGVGVGIGIAAVLIAILIFFLWRRRQRMLAKREEEDEFRSLEGRPNLFSYSELKTATKSFSDENKLGQGGFGAVYKGVLSDGRVVAVKKLSTKSEDKRDFLNEATVIAAVQHRNLVKLQGCCIEGDERILVMEFLENNSLHQALFGSKHLRSQLDWKSRFNICMGVARGIAYLHEESLPRIIHRDIKASNVLLDKDLNPKIADFGLAKLFNDRETHISTRVAGTIGYLSPEYAMRGYLTEKADVYSFGVLTLEMVSGRQNLDTSLPNEKVYLLEWAWQLYESNEPLELLDDQVSEVDEEQALRVIQVALLCTQAVAASRPSMSYAVGMLAGTTPANVSALGPGYFTALKNAAPDFFTNAAISLGADSTPEFSSSNPSLLT